MEILLEEKLALERRRQELNMEIESAIRDLKSEFDKTKNQVSQREKELADLQNERRRVEEELEQKRLATSKLMKDIEEIKYRNHKFNINLSDLKKSCKRKVEESQDMQERIEGVQNELGGLNSDNNQLENMVMVTEDEVNITKSKKGDGDKERNFLTRERDEETLKLSEINRSINSVEGQIMALERDLYNSKYDKEIHDESLLYQNDLNKNSQSMEDIERIEILLKQRLNELEDIKRELKKTQNLYQQVDDDNRFLEIDIEKYREAIRNLTLQNDELVNELDKITEQDESIRYILNRKSRISTLIHKAETNVERSQIKQESLHYSPNRTKK